MNPISEKKESLDARLSEAFRRVSPEVDSARLDAEEDALWRRMQVQRDRRSRVGNLPFRRRWKPAVLGFAGLALVLVGIFLFLPSAPTPSGPVSPETVAKNVQASGNAVESALLELDEALDDLDDDERRQLFAGMNQVLAGSVRSRNEWKRDLAEGWSLDDDFTDTESGLY